MGFQLGFGDMIPCLNSKQMVCPVDKENFRQPKGI